MGQILPETKLRSMLSQRNDILHSRSIPETISSAGAAGEAPAVPPRARAGAKGRGRAPQPVLATPRGEGRREDESQARAEGGSRAEGGGAAPMPVAAPTPGRNPNSGVVATLFRDFGSGRAIRLRKEK